VPKELLPAPKPPNAELGCAAALLPAGIPKFDDPNGPPKGDAAAAAVFEAVAAELLTPKGLGLGAEAEEKGVAKALEAALFAFPAPGKEAGPLRPRA
jgi:hypothetical protein